MKRRRYAAAPSHKAVLGSLHMLPRSDSPLCREQRVDDNACLRSQAVIIACVLWEGLSLSSSSIRYFMWKCTWLSFKSLSAVGCWILVEPMKQVRDCSLMATVTAVRSTTLVFPLNCKRNLRITNCHVTSAISAKQQDVSSCSSSCQPRVSDRSRCKTVRWSLSSLSEPLMKT